MKHQHQRQHQQHQDQPQWQTYHYFAYGANTNLDSMARRCPNARSLGRVTLKDWQFRFARHADVVPCPGDAVEGVLWEITEECLASLDAFEGFPVYYGRETVTVTSPGGLTISDVIVYVMTPGHEDAPPDDYYLDTLAEGYVAHGVSIRQICDAYYDSQIATTTESFLAELKDVAH
jgi:gamma-glutamylcyclotransferase (GGCT)/AIG2-like uncharacterized protein YtfP